MTETQPQIGERKVVAGIEVVWTYDPWCDPCYFTPQPTWCNIAAMNRDGHALPEGLGGDGGTEV